MNKKQIVYISIFSVTLLIAIILFLNLNQNEYYFYIASLLLLLSATMMTLWLRSENAKAIKTSQSQATKQTSDEKLSATTKPKEEDEIDKLYKTIEQYPEVGVAKFLKSGIKFDIDGTFYYKKDYNDIEGYHFAFFIKSTKFNYVPEENESLHIFDSFFAEIGYHDEYPLEEENECGVIVEDLKTIKNTTIDLDYDDGYVFTIYTADFDMIDYGQLKILDFDNDTMTISFKLAVKSGLDDIVTGTVKLKLDTQEGLSD